MEIKQRAPDVLDFLVTVAAPKVTGDADQQIPPLCAAYGILMNSRCVELLKASNKLPLQVNGHVLFSELDAYAHT